VTPALWFDAKVLAAAGVQTGSRVSVWPDSSGGGRNATQSNPAFQPVFYANALGPGAPALRFDGNASYLSGPTAWSAPSTFVAVVLQDCAPPTTTCCSGVFVTGNSAGGGPVMGLSTAKSGSNTAVFADATAMVTPGSGV